MEKTTKKINNKNIKVQEKKIVSDTEEEITDKKKVTRTKKNVKKEVVSESDTEEEITDKKKVTGNKKNVKKEAVSDTKEEITDEKKVTGNKKNVKKEVVSESDTEEDTATERNDDISETEENTTTEKKENLSKNETEKNDHGIIKTLNTNEVEEKMDDKIPKYNKYSKDHPMEGVSYDSKGNTYRIYYNEINTHAKKLETACQKVIKNFRSKLNKPFVLNCPKNNFMYQNKNFICYWKDNQPYFDIHHIIAVLKQGKTSKVNKYNEFSEGICYYILHKNKYGGYILRELIHKETMYNIILSSVSDISKSFKKDVSKILSQLQDNNMIVVTNDNIKLKKNPKNENEEAKIILDDIKNEIVSYKNEKYIYYLKGLVVRGSKISLCPYLKKHVLYAFIMPIKVQHDYTIVKYGYTEDIINRIISLER